VSDSSLAVKDYKFHSQVGISPRYAAPETYSKLRDGSLGFEVFLFFL